MNWYKYEWECYQDQPGDYLLYEAYDEDRDTVIGAMVVWLDTVEQDIKEGHLPWNCFILDSFITDKDEAEDVLMYETTDANILDDLGSYNTYDEAADVLMRAIGL